MGCLAGSLARCCEGEEIWVSLAGRGNHSNACNLRAREPACQEGSPGAPSATGPAHVAELVDKELVAQLLLGQDPGDKVFSDVLVKEGGWGGEGWQGTKPECSCWGASCVSLSDFSLHALLGCSTPLHVLHQTPDPW